MLKVPAYGFEYVGTQSHRQDVEISLSQNDLSFASGENGEPREDVPIWPKLVEKVEEALRDKSDRRNSFLLDEHGGMYRCQPSDSSLFLVRRGLCRMSSVIASILGIRMKTDRRIMKNTPTDSVIASFTHFGKGPTFVYSHSGIQFILRGLPGPEVHFPSVNINTVRLSDMADIGKSVDVASTTEYEKIKSYKEEGAVMGSANI